MAAPRKYDLEFRERAVWMYRDRLADLTCATFGGLG